MKIDCQFSTTTHKSRCSFVSHCRQHRLPSILSLLVLLFTTNVYTTYTYAFTVTSITTATSISSTKRSCTYHNQRSCTINLVDRCHSHNLYEYRCRLPKTSLHTSSYDDDNTEDDSTSSIPPVHPRDQWYNSATTTSLVGTQASLIPIVIVIATLCHIDINFLNNDQQQDPSSSSSMYILYGIITTLPLIIFIKLLDSIEQYVPALQDVTNATYRFAYTLLGGTYKPLLAIVVSITLGCIAGFGEELLFRGIIQDSLYNNINTIPILYQNAALSIGITSILFGLCHAVTPFYVLFATIISIYFGIIYITIGQHQLIVPILCHSLYDIYALFYTHYIVTNQLSIQEIQELIEPDTSMNENLK